MNKLHTIVSRSFFERCNEKPLNQSTKFCNGKPPLTNPSIFVMDSPNPFSQSIKIFDSKNIRPVGREAFELHPFGQEYYMKQEPNQA
jgi:hypothetical protein